MDELVLQDFRSFNAKTAGRWLSAIGLFSILVIIAAAFEDPGPSLPDLTVGCLFSLFCFTLGIKLPKSEDERVVLDRHKRELRFQGADGLVKSFPYESLQEPTLLAGRGRSKMWTLAVTTTGGEQLELKHSLIERECLEKADVLAKELGLELKRAERPREPLFRPRRKETES